MKRLFEEVEMGSLGSSTLWTAGGVGQAYRGGKGGMRHAEKEASTVGAWSRPLEEIAKEKKVFLVTTDYGEMLEQE